MIDPKASSNIDENVLMDKFQHEVSILLGLYDYEVNAIINADEIPIYLDVPHYGTQRSF